MAFSGVRFSSIGSCFRRDLFLLIKVEVAQVVLSAT